MADRPLLEEFFSRELDEMERVLQLGREGKHRADDFKGRGSDHHFGKADSHMVRMGAYYDGRDHETGTLHGLLAVLRLLMCLRCSEESES